MFKQVIIFILLISVFFSTNCQTLERQVVVTKDFEPVIQNADKINNQPDVKDTIQIKPGFSYRIYPIPAKTSFQVKEIKAAKLVGIPISEIYNYYLKAGVGNHQLPLIEAYANNLRSNKYNYGAAFNMTNLEGKVKLENGQKVDAASNNIDLSFFGKIFLKEVNLDGLAGIEANKINNYGLSPDTIYDILPEKDEIINRFTTLYTRASVYNTLLNPHYSFIFSMDEQYTWDRSKYFENDIDVRLNNKIRITLFDIHLDAAFKSLKNNFSGDTLGGLSDISFSPYLKNYKGDFRYQIGMKLTVESSQGHSEPFIYPLANIEYSLAGSILTTFFSLEGNLQTNSYRDVLHENPFISPASEIRPSNNKFKASAGFKGDITKNLAYHVTGELLNVEDHILYVNDTIGRYNNYYKIIYDDIDITHIQGGLDYTIKKKFSLSLEGNKYYYMMKEEDQPWHLPDWDINLYMKYYLQKKMVFSCDMNIIGKRYAKDINEQEVQMKPFAVFNFQTDYYFSKVLSAFVSVKNLNASQYAIWYQYSCYKVMVTLGGAYRF